MSEQQKEKWDMVTGLVKWFVLSVLVLGWNGAIVAMLLQGRIDDINAIVWTIYAAVMSAFGIPVAYQGVKTLRKGQ